MSPVTMPQLARRLGVSVERVGFAARLGRLPQPIGRDADGLLVFDADTIDWPIRRRPSSLGARTDAAGNDTSRITRAGCA